MKVITRRFDVVGRRTYQMNIYPLGDIHIGARACDEDRFRADVQAIADDPDGYWVGMGDYCDFINMSDPRFSPTTLAPWIGMSDLADLAKAQSQRFVELTAPIADKCLALVEGNHETAITRHYERSIYNEIVTGVKERGGFNPEDHLGLGYYGWLVLRFTGSGAESARGNWRTFRFVLHHGFVGGKLAGAKALNMQRQLWTHDCDVALMGHSHNLGVQREAVEALSGSDNAETRIKVGAYTGTYLRRGVEGSNSYAEVKGYFPQPAIGGPVITLRPYAPVERRIKVAM